MFLNLYISVNVEISINVLSVSFSLSSWENWIFSVLFPKITKSVLAMLKCIHAYVENWLTDEQEISSLCFLVKQSSTISMWVLAGWSRPALQQVATAKHKPFLLSTDCSRRTERKVIEKQAAREQDREAWEAFVEIASPCSRSHLRMRAQLCSVSFIRQKGALLRLPPFTSKLVVQGSVYTSTVPERG